MQEVPLKSIKCGKFVKNQTNCSLVLPETETPRLDFLYENSKNGDTCIFRLQCEKITAVDLRVEAKFGSIDAMQGTLLVECSLIEIKNSTLQTINNAAQFPETFNNNSAARNCLVHATFHVNETGAVRDIIRKLRGIYSKSNIYETTAIKKPKSNTKHFNEGLPIWVQFIPHYMYSKRIRQCIQFVIYVYTVFSITWALWQLYRHVDFVRESMRPLINILQYEYQLLNYAIQFFNTIFEEYTVQWLCFLKPLHTVISTMAAPLLQTVRQLGPVFQIVTQSVTYCCSVLWPVVKPIVGVGYQFVYVIHAIVRTVTTILARLWWLLLDISVPPMVRMYLGAIKRMLGTLWHSLGQAQLDPIKAQLVIVRTTVLHSSKAIGFGTVRLVRKIYKIIWLRRSARVEKQE